MIIVMETNAPPDAVEAVKRTLIDSGQQVQQIDGTSRTLIAVLGKVPPHGRDLWRDLPYVEDVVRIEDPFYLASRRFRRTPTVVSGSWGNIGGGKPWLAIEPIGIEHVSDVPHDIAAGRPFDAAVVRAPVEPRPLGALACLPLERRPGALTDVVFVLREPSWGANVWIEAAERELADGRNSVVLLEAGGEYPNGARTLEIAAIARAKIRTHLPIVVDASTIAQRTRYVAAVAQAAVAAGADGVFVRTWVGPAGQMPSAPATLAWADAMALGVRLRAIAAAAAQV